jgi:hypothetical protein
LHAALLAVGAQCLPLLLQLPLRRPGRAALRGTARTRAQARCSQSSPASIGAAIRVAAVENDNFSVRPCPRPQPAGPAAFLLDVLLDALLLLERDGCVLANLLLHLNLLGLFSNLARSAAHVALAHHLSTAHSGIKGLVLELTSTLPLLAASISACSFVCSQLRSRSARQSTQTWPPLPRCVQTRLCRRS